MKTSALRDAWGVEPPQDMHPKEVVQVAVLPSPQPPSSTFILSQHHRIHTPAATDTSPRGTGKVASPS